MQFDIVINNRYLIFHFLIQLLHPSSEFFPLCSLAIFSANLCLRQCGPLDIEIISEDFIVMLRHLSYEIMNQLKAPKAPY